VSHAEVPWPSLGRTSFRLALDSDTICYRPLEGLTWLQRGRGALPLRHLPTADAALQPRPRAGPLSPEFLGLVCTRGCGLACRYCDFEAPRGDLSVPLALRAVDWFCELCAREGRSEVAIELFGGDPLHTPEVVEAVALRAWLRAPQLGMRPALRLLTSGVGPGPLKDLVADLFVEVTVSIDGPPDVHNRLRPLLGGGGSFGEAADMAERVAAGQATLSLRSCVPASSVSGLVSSAGTLGRLFGPARMAFEPLRGNARSRAAGLAPPPADAFVGAFLRAAPELRAAGTEPLYSGAVLGEPTLSFCPVARDGFLVGPGRGAAEARVSACYLPAASWRARGLELEYGSLGVDGGLHIDRSRLRAVRGLHVGSKPRCRSCFMRLHCAGACHVHHSYPGAPLEYDDTCRIVRALGYAELLRSLELGDALERFTTAPWDPVELVDEPSRGGRAGLDSRSR